MVQISIKNRSVCHQDWILNIILIIFFVLFSLASRPKPIAAGIQGLSFYLKKKFVCWKNLVFCKFLAMEEGIEIDIDIDINCDMSHIPFIAFIVFIYLSCIHRWYVNYHIAYFSVIGHFIGIGVTWSVLQFPRRSKYTMSQKLTTINKWIF